MKNFFKSFFSTSNDINENTIMGVIFAVVAIVAVFIAGVDDPKFYTLCGMTLGFFGIGSFKK